MAGSRFTIRRKDRNVDPVVIEGDGLAIGRSPDNDLQLNHPAVSRIHAGIKELNGDYWISNLSQANGTLLNGKQIAQTPLADGDVIQIGPFFLRASYLPEGLALDVEIVIGSTASGEAATLILPQTAENQKTLVVDLAAMAQQQKPTPTGIWRIPDFRTGMLTAPLTPVDEQALKLFWNARQREAGKLSSESPLKPKATGRLGKTQFNWRPTGDLQRAWSPAIFAWGALIIGALSAVAAFAFTRAYSPAPLSVAHTRRDLSITPAIALRPNAGACTTCHRLTSSKQQNCTSCHTTKAFHPDISTMHTKVGLTCVDCHDEHHGGSFRAALIADARCTHCHQDGSGVVSPLTGQRLKTPHGGGFGDPVVNGNWRYLNVREDQWRRKQLPGSPSDFSAKEQFHLIHVAGRNQGRLNCSDCHAAGFEGAALAKVDRKSCIPCHRIGPQEATVVQVTIELAEMQATGAIAAGAPRCVSCHAQHGEERDLTTSIRRISRIAVGPSAPTRQ
jgi:hypothetical protein